MAQHGRKKCSGKLSKHGKDFRALIGNLWDETRGGGSNYKEILCVGGKCDRFLVKNEKFSEKVGSNRNESFG